MLRSTFQTFVWLILPAVLVACTTTAPTASRAKPPTSAEPNHVAVITAAGMSCPLCAANIDRQFERIDGFTDLRMNLDTGELFVNFTGPTRPDDAQLAQAIADAGFTVDAVRWLPPSNAGGEQ